MNPVALKWFDLGLQLDLDYGELRNISGDGGKQACFRDMLAEWMDTGTPMTAAILTALRSPSLCYHILANELKKMEGIVHLLFIWFILSQSLRTILTLTSATA